MPGHMPHEELNMSVYSRLKNTHGSVIRSHVCVGCPCGGLWKPVRVFILWAVTLLGFGLLVGIWISVVTAE